MTILQIQRPFFLYKYSTNIKILNVNLTYFLKAKPTNKKYQIFLAFVGKSISLYKQRSGYAATHLWCFSQPASTSTLRTGFWVRVPLLTQLHYSASASSAVHCFFLKLLMWKLFKSCEKPLNPKKKVKKTFMALIQQVIWLENQFVISDMYLI